MLDVKEPSGAEAQPQPGIETERAASATNAERASGSEMVVVMGLVALGAMMVGFLLGLLF